MLTLFLLIQLLATGFMTGLIWFVQVVHYPLFASVGSREFPRYEDQHTRRTTIVVAPVMIVEAGCCIALLMVIHDGPLLLLGWIGAAILCVIWASTALLQIPCHRQLSQGFARSVAHRLNVSNWIRTAAWSLRAVIAAAMIALVGRP